MAAPGGLAGKAGEGAGTVATTQEAEGALPSVIYREGNPSPSNLTPRAIDQGKLSFRDSLSNP
jgi:hypothetical protein